MRKQQTYYRIRLADSLFIAGLGSRPLWADETRNGMELTLDWYIADNGAQYESYVSLSQNPHAALKYHSESEAISFMNRNKINVKSYTIEAIETEAEVSHERRI